VRLYRRVALLTGEAAHDQELKLQQAMAQAMAQSEQRDIDVAIEATAMLANAGDVFRHHEQDMTMMNAGEVGTGGISKTVP